MRKKGGKEGARERGSEGGREGEMFCDPQPATSSSSSSSSSNEEISSLFLVEGAFILTVRKRI